TPNVRRHPNHTRAARWFESSRPDLFFGSRWKSGGFLRFRPHQRPGGEVGEASAEREAAPWGSARGPGTLARRAGFPSTARSAARCRTAGTEADPTPTSGSADPGRIERRARREVSWGGHLPLLRQRAPTSRRSSSAGLDRAYESGDSSTVSNSESPLRSMT